MTIYVIERSRYNDSSYAYDIEVDVDFGYFTDLEGAQEFCDKFNRENYDKYAATQKKSYQAAMSEWRRHEKKRQVLAEAGLDSSSPRTQPEDRTISFDQWLTQRWNTDIIYRPIEVEPA